MLRISSLLWSQRMHHHGSARAIMKKDVVSIVEFTLTHFSQLAYNPEGWIW